ncbi:MULTISPECIES: arsenate reductase/protein-tyrosine-phosphatase family protein [Glycomyces]|uniref:Phosphotyrosine protein phosphatase n=2 Tax=Glycomyces TaxID=58113 RepID=A0A9X3SVJ8_9ACTN|nr:phosphotyrosine protein phosphatase [Glycomyces lechevalierae]MDA1384872.1 phosphotyrosine protein phosphatase [Glycomyces lechevalierae]MDR7337676.1 protein-tyrosine phosphatase [Glycomyces lechevalierae]
MTSPFTVLHVCTGNICRSPMSERILAGLTGEDVYNHGAGISAYHEGENMQNNAMTELESRGYDPDGHRARHLLREHVEASDLILVATIGHLDYIAERFPEAVAKTFLVRSFGPMAADLADSLPDGDTAVRGKALVDAADARRGGYDELDLADPWGMSQTVYAKIADQLETALKPVASALEPR